MNSKNTNSRTVFVDEFASEEFQDSEMNRRKAIRLAITIDHLMDIDVCLSMNPNNDEIKP